MKYLLYSDIHFCQYSSIVRKRGPKYSVRLHNLIKSLNWAEELADRLSVDEVICLGDTFDRSDLNAEEITALQDVVFSKIKHTFITGNHDANVASLDFSSAKIFETIGADIITEPIKKDINEFIELYFIPYISDNKVHYLSDYVDVNSNKKKIVMTHNDLAGIQYGRIISKSGFDIDNILENCNLFLDGHLHNGGFFYDNHVVLVGNLTGQNFNENAFKFGHYAYVLTVENDKITLEPYENPYAFNFYKIIISSGDDLSIFNTIKNNSVLSVVCVSNLLSTVNSLLENNDKVTEYRLVSMYNRFINGESDTADFVVEDHLQQFIDYVQTKLEPSDVLSDELARLNSM